MLTIVHLISDFLCDRFDWTYLFLDEGFHFSLAIFFPTILAFFSRPSHTVILKASPLACRTLLSKTLAAAATTTSKMANNKDNNNDKDKDLPQDERERRQRIREERERRRALASRGKEELVVNPPALHHLFRHANSPAEASSSSATDTQRAPHPHPSSAAALDAAAAVPLPGNDDDLDSDQLLASEEETDENPPPYEEDEDGMDVDDMEPPAPIRKWNVSITREAPKQGELDVGPSRPWVPNSQKDGTIPSSVREIAIQCDYGGASLARRRKHMIASRRRHDRKRRELMKAEKSSAREVGRQDPHPDAEADRAGPSQPAAILSQPGSGSGPASLATPRQGGEKPPAKKAKQGLPSKKKEEKKDGGPRFSPVRAPAQQPEKQVQPSSSSGGSRAPRR